MTLTVTPNDPTVPSLNLDESQGRQNATDTPAPAGDADDHDVLRSAILPALDTLLFDAAWMNLSPTFPDGGRIAKVDNLLKVSAGDPIADIHLAGVAGADLPEFDESAPAAGAPSGWTTTAGDTIYLYDDYISTGETVGWAEQAGLAGDLVFGVDDDGDLAFVLLMEEAAGASSTEKLLSFTFLTFQPIADLDAANDHDNIIDLGDNLTIVADQTGGFIFENVPPNKVNWLHAPSAAAGDDGGLLIHSTTNVTEINTSNVTEFTVGWGSQGINAGETVALTYADVQDPSLALPQLKGKDAKDAGNINVDNTPGDGGFADETGFSFTIVQAVGNKTHSVQVQTFGVGATENDGANFYNGFADDTLVDVDYVKVDFATGGSMEFALDPSGTLSKTDPATGTTITFVKIDIDTITDVSFDVGNGNPTDSDAIDDVWVAQILDLAEGDRISIETDGVHQRGWITGLSGNLDIGRITTSSSITEHEEIGEFIKHEDAGPSITHAAKTTPPVGGLFKNLDETIGTPDIANASEGESADNNSDADDTANSMPTYETNPDGFGGTTEAIGQLETTAGAIKALFDTPTVSFDTDGPGSLGGGTGTTDTLSFVLTGDGTTNLLASPVTGTGSGIDAMSPAHRTISLEVKAGTNGTVIEGKIAGTGGGDDYVILRMTIETPNDPDSRIIYEQFAPVVQDNNDFFDEQKNLLLTNGGTLAIKWDVNANDGDGDSAMKSASVTVTDGSTSILGIDDDGPVGSGFDDIPIEEGDLPWGNDLNDSKPGMDNSTNTTNFAATLFQGTTATAGIEGAPQFSLSTAASDVTKLVADNAGLSHDGMTVKFDITGNTITGYVDDGAGGNNGTLDADDTQIFTFVITAVGMGTFTLLNYVDHAPGAGENALFIKLGAVVIVSDVEGDRLRVDGDVTYDVKDDLPVLAVGNLVGTGTTDPQTGFWDGNVGADDDPVTALQVTGWTIGTTTGTGTVDVTKDGSDPWSWNVKITDDFDLNGTTPDTTVEYDITFNGDGTYTFDLVSGFGSTISSRKTADGSLDAGGPDLARTVSFSDAPDIVFFAVKDEAVHFAGIQAFLDDSGGGDDTDEDEPDVEALEGMPGGEFLASGAKLNASSSGFGNGSNNFDTGQSMVVNPIDDPTVSMNVYISAKTVGGYDPGPEVMKYVIYWADGTHSGPITVGASDVMEFTEDVPKSDPRRGTDFFTVENPTLKVIDAVQLIMETGKVKIVEIEVFSIEESVANPLYIDMSLSLTDDDSDPETSAFAVDLETDPLLDPPAPNFTLEDNEFGGTDDQPDAFNVDLSDPDAKLWAIDGFDTGVDTLVLVNQTAAGTLVTSGVGDDVLTVDGDTIRIRNGAEEIAPSDIDGVLV